MRAEEIDGLRPDAVPGEGRDEIPDFFKDYVVDLSHLNASSIIAVLRRYTLSAARFFRFDAHLQADHLKQVEDASKFRVALP